MNESEREKERERQIAERLRQMPKSQRANYLKAQEGNSRCAGIRAECLDCMGYKIEEVRQCTVLGCPLYPYRPYQQTPQNSHEGHSDDVERPNEGPVEGRCDNEERAESDDPNGQEGEQYDE